MVIAFLGLKSKGELFMFSTQDKAANFATMGRQRDDRVAFERRVQELKDNFASIRRVKTQETALSDPKDYLTLEDHCFLDKIYDQGLRLSLMLAILEDRKKGFDKPLSLDYLLTSQGPMERLIKNASFVDLSELDLSHQDLKSLVKDLIATVKNAFLAAKNLKANKSLPAL